MRNRILPRALILALILLALVATWWTGARSHAAGAVIYRLSVPNPADRTLLVEVRFEGASDPFDLHLSRSSPGRYSLHDFAKNLFDLTVTDGTGRPLVAEPLATNRWRIAAHGGVVQVRYRVFGDRIDGTYIAIDRTHAHINLPAVLIWSPEFAFSPARVTVVPPAGSNWRLATQLLPTDDAFTVTAPNLPYLMDSPIELSAFEWRTFEADLATGVAGPPPHIAVAVHHTGVAADVDGFVADLRKIVREEGAVFGEFPPYEGGRYTFLADYLPWAIGDGMEHRNSTVITGTSSLAGGRRFALDAAAHEFFHGWNVERIRPRGLEPFNLDDQNVTGELWLAEGVTSYYEMVVQQRAGLSTLDDVAEDISRAVGEVMTSPSHAFRSAADMSRMAPFVDGESPQDRTNLGLTFMSYYTYGAALGLGIDLSLREKTAGAHSLDDVMRWLWVRYGKPGGASPGIVDRPVRAGRCGEALAAVSGDRTWADRFLADYVNGRSVMDYPRLLALAGFVVSKRAPGEASLGLIPIERSGGRLRLVGPVPPDSPAAAAGLGADDELIAIDHRPIADAGGLEPTIRRYRPGDRVILTAQLRGESAPHDLPVVLTEDTRVDVTTLEQTGKKPDARQLAFRQQWLGGR